MCTMTFLNPARGLLARDARAGKAIVAIMIDINISFDMRAHEHTDSDRRAAQRKLGRVQ